MVAIVKAMKAVKAVKAIPGPALPDDQGLALLAEARVMHPRTAGVLLSGADDPGPEPRPKWRAWIP